MTEARSRSPFLEMRTKLKIIFLFSGKNRLIHLCLKPQWNFFLTNDLDYESRLVLTLFIDDFKLYEVKKRRVEKACGKAKNT